MQQIILSVLLGMALLTAGCSSRVERPAPDPAPPEVTAGDLPVNANLAQVIAAYERGEWAALLKVTAPRLTAAEVLTFRYLQLSARLQQEPKSVKLEELTAIPVAQLPVRWRPLYQLDQAQLLLALGRVDEALKLIPSVDLTSQKPPLLARLQSRQQQLLTQAQGSGGGKGGSVRHVAVLLPFTGKFSSAAQALRDGLIYQWALDRSAQPMQLRFYDTSDEPEQGVKQYQEALANGAEAVIGPLVREVVDAVVVSQNPKKVPVLLLNSSSRDLTGSSFYPFALSPEDEADDIADRAWREGYTRAALLVTDSALGKRVAAQFRRTWGQKGGVVVNQVNFSEGINDYSNQIQLLLNLDESESRFERLKSVVGNGRKIEFEPYRRQDVDFIMMVAQPKQGRVLRPQLKFYRASAVPVLATSHIYNADSDVQANSDLDGILFSDTPWNLADKKSRPDGYAQLKQSYSGQLERLVAMGADAYGLLPQLKTLAQNPTQSYSGQSGYLSVGKDNRVRRIGQWARFEGGVAVLLQANQPVALDPAREGADEE